MSNNQEKYKNAINQIHASDELKEKTIQKMKEKRKENKVVYFKYLSACAMFVVAIGVGSLYYQKTNTKIAECPVAPVMPSDNTTQTQMVSLNKDLQRFESIEELKSVLKENTYSQTNGIYDELDVVLAETETATTTKSALNSDKQESIRDLSSDDYSKTNVQVENVDEADIVKTDGEYIYYITQNTVYIIKADNLEIVSSKNIYSDKERFSPEELYINKDKLIVIGTYNTYQETENTVKKRYSYFLNQKVMTQAIVYDISNKADPEEIRTVRLDGYYKDSRMIGENIYVISSKNAYYYDEIKEDEILPLVYDTKTGERIISATDIAYFPNTNSFSFMTVAGFDINNDNVVCTETFFGASDEIYASQNHLYITQRNYDNYDYRNSSNTIYKFKLNGSKIEMLCKGEVKGNLNNQFSMDEYEGNLRIATTSGYDDEDTNQLYVFDENLKELSRIENIAVGEKIYAVRFIGKIGYVVTFEQIDPLFLIDLSDPRNPSIKGELKIPGYSSYLHPYDETHIIGIGYNTKSNGYGGVTNANMKMSMFDVSDLENPREMFSVDIGEEYASSSIMYNHKVLFENKSKDLIGFPVTYRNYLASEDKDAFTIYHIDLEKGFERYGEISHEINYRTNIDRAIYIGNTLYTLANTEIRSYNLDTFEHIKTLEIEEKDIITEDLYVKKTID